MKTITSEQFLQAEGFIQNEHGVFIATQGKDSFNVSRIMDEYAEIKKKEWAISQMEVKWIEIKSANDFPKKYGSVIIYGRFTKDCPKNVYEAVFNPKGGKFYSDGILSKSVTHWMPLPSPPKDERSQDNG